ncbi:histidinol dehydrogenase [Alkalibacillus aidingensis]|uniref:histidinol dehydrogenase n=1 Tax=Alkalibacillus aidingensis TaxID=2747607 RepID=UPI001660F525|nr:histidinol dehydrogenase [Alkalibacillus aidingensis]
MRIEKVEQDELEQVAYERSNRDQTNYDQVDERVHEIVHTIRREGNDAVYQYINQLDGVELTDFRVSELEFEQAFEKVSEQFISVLQEAKGNISRYHALQKEQSWFTNDQEGIWLGQQIRPMKRVGVYVPGGKAAYPSTVLMNVLPAKVAGVKQVVVTTPVQPDGKVNPNTLVAAKIAGADEVLKIGGAHGIATLAYGTETVQAVDKIVGPGNAYVARAKKYVFGDVGIDMIAGPSEVCIVVDADANPRFVAADLLAQAEHDELASSIVVTDCPTMARQIQDEVERQLQTLNRQDILKQSISNQGVIYLMKSLDLAFDLVNQLAPEHLELHVNDPFQKLSKVENAGAIFLGEYSPEPLGDYFAGPNHTLPTDGTAKFSSPLGVYDFMKKSSVIYYDQTALAEASQQIEYFAKEEGLDAHAESIRIRFK